MTALELLATIVAALDAAEIPHMVTGSTASSVHGEPRSTQDIDIVIDPVAETLRTFVDGLDSQRFHVGDALSALVHRDMFNILDLASGWKVDLIIIKDRPFSRSEFERRIAVDLGGTAVHVATAEDTILAKLEWARLGGSERQRRDVAAVLAVSGDRLDRRYLHRWAGILGLAEDLEEAERQASG